MVKGVNKTIIEINNTGSKYFDRVLLFVNPAYSGVPQSKLEAVAADIIRSAEQGRTPPRRVMRRRRIIKRRLIILAALAAAVGIILAILL